ncbi:DNA primase large subunit-like [Paramacrobiotus metropolitanus]|uniref:DNA primase large subunit-like n=1 Tax=Paramacrobiotus metropolitanus TaxID=2943436 RepID=UPI0024459B7F|nr:DNA primase large subunit-like [Paramacrobiotus metropolitanus]
MEQIGSAKKAIRNKHPVYDEEVLPYDTNFFMEPPYEAITTLQDFEEYAQERLKVLRAVENVGVKCRKFSQQYYEQINNDLTKELRNRYIRMTNKDSVEIVLQERQRDALSHFILQMVFSRNEDQRRWFIQQESELFRLRLGLETAPALSRFISDNALGYTALPDEEWKNLRDILQGSTFNGQTESEFYKMDWVESLNQVRQRHVFVNQGYAYVPRKHLVDVIAARFREHLSHQMAKLVRIMTETQENTRLFPLFARLVTGYSGKDYSVNETDFGINLDNLNQLAVESFPVCARHMHENFRRDHHLRHWARLQYWLFLKGIGLPMDDTIKLTRLEFSRHGLNESQLKNMDYGVRHSYGREGRRANYNPPSCMKIITQNPPGQGEHHGCPFKHFSEGMLRQKLTTYGMNSDEAKQIMDLKVQNHYQHACTRYFELFHAKHDKPVLGMPTIEHPNQYFEESRRLLHPESVKDKPPVFSRRSSAPDADGNFSMTLARENFNDCEMSEMDIPIDDDLMRSYETVMEKESASQ